ncbi:MAG: hypothetical protein EHM41_18565 [Chloroflexi bacterium]|nr:MAG: hypothetical protein EHM41_18565 [Chloroflexota bacterium]
MNHRERVQAVLKHQKPDIPVVDLGGRVASLHWRAYLDLKTYLGFGDKLEGEEITSLNTISNIDERILSLFNVPFRRLYLKPASSFHKDVAADGSFRDEWGVLYRPVGLYNERTGFPLADAALADLNSFSWPDPSDSGRVQDLAEQA